MNLNDIKLPIGLPDYWGFGELAEFDRAFIHCLKDGVHPGPKELGIRMYGHAVRTLNDRLVCRRYELMLMFNVAYQKNYEPGTVPLKDKFPNHRTFHWSEFLG